MKTRRFMTAGPLSLWILAILSILSFRSAASAQQLYIAEDFNNYDFSPLWSIAEFKDDIYDGFGQPRFVDMAGRGGVLHYFIPEGRDEVTPVQMSLEGDGAFSRVTGQRNLHEFYLEWSEYFPNNHDFADIGQKLVRFTYWNEGEGRNVELNWAVLNDNHRIQLSMIAPHGRLDGGSLDWWVDTPPIPTGRWVRFGLWIKLNTPGRADGFAYVYMDGQPIVAETNKSFRGNDSRGFNVMWIGGNHSNMSRPTTRSSSRYLDDILLYSTKPGGRNGGPVNPVQPQPPQPQPPAPPPPAPETPPPAPIPRGPGNNRPIKDFNADGRGDFAVWRPQSGTWYVRTNSDQPNDFVKQWGLPGDKPIRGDYDGDGALDLAVWRPGNGTWYICFSGQGYDCSRPRVEQFGIFGDYPLSGDVDGDGRTDLIVWRPLLVGRFGFEVGQWHYRRSSDGGAGSLQWGLPYDVPNVADYDGDGRDDFGVFRPLTGEWFRKSVAPGANLDPGPFQWGLNGDHPMAADFDGDDRADPVVWRPSSGTWYVCPSTAGPHGRSCSNGVAYQFGLPGDKPVIGSFDGSGSASFAVWRPALGGTIGTWYILSSNGQFRVQQWGLPGDMPIGMGAVDLAR